MSIFNRARELAQLNAETAHDMNDTSGGGGARILLPAGEYYGYLAQYVELGKHPDEFEGKHTGDFMRVRLGVAIFHDEDEDNEDAYEIIRPFPLNIKTGDRSGSVKVFRGLNVENDPDIKTIAEFLGVPRRFKVLLKKNKKGKEYNEIDFAATGLAVEGVGRKAQPVTLPDIDEKHVQVFFWDHPTVEDWDSLFIESNNFIQNDIVNAIDFPGSPIDTLLQTEGIELPEFEAKPEQEDDAPAPTTGGVTPEDDDAPQEEAPVGKPARAAARQSPQTNKATTSASSATTSPSSAPRPTRPRATRAKA